MTDIAWGPEIRVDGKRPEWLRNDEPNLAYKRESGIGYGYNCSTPFAWTEHDIINNKGGWSTVTNIRLPAGHPHYSKAPTAPERDPALWDRMEALTRRIAKGFYLHAVNEEGIGTTDAVVKAQQIIAALPKPVDADEKTAWRIREAAFQADSGSMERDWITTAVMEGIKHGRAAQDAARG